MNTSRRMGLVVTPLLAAGAIGLGIGSAAPMGAPLVFGLAALMAMDRPIGIILGLLALGATASGNVGAMTLHATGGAGVVAAGLGLGLVARSTPTWRWRLGASGALGTSVWLTVILCLLMWLPTGLLRLVDGGGDVFLLDVVVQDPVMGTSFLRHVPIWVEDSSALTVLHEGLPWLTFAILCCLLFARASRRVDVERFAWQAMRVFGLVLVVVGLFGGVQLVYGTVALPSVEALQLRLTQLAGADLSAEVVGGLDGARIGLASRPIIDLLRVLIGGLVWAVSSGALRGPQVLEPLDHADALTPLALGLWVCAAVLIPGQTLSLGLAAAGVLLTASWVTGRLINPPSRMSHDLMWAALLMACFTWLAPVAGWLDQGLGS